MPETNPVSLRTRIPNSPYRITTTKNTNNNYDVMLTSDISNRMYDVRKNVSPDVLQHFYNDILNGKRSISEKRKTHQASKTVNIILARTEGKLKNKAHGRNGTVKNKSITKRKTHDLRTIHRTTKSKSTRRATRQSGTKIH